MTIAFVAAALALLTTVAALRRTAWASRGITLGLPFPILAVIQNALALPAGLFVADRVGPTAAFATAAAVGAASFTWLAVLAIASDLSSRMLPREACNTVSLIGIPLVAVTWARGPVFSLVVCAIGLIGLPWLARILTRRGLGFGDIRLLTAATLTLSWWVGSDYLLYALIGACLLQMVVRALTWPWRNRLGDQEPLLVKKPEPESVQTTEADADATAEGIAAERTPLSRTRRALPFAPALAISMLTAAAYVTVTRFDVCVQWVGTGC